MMVLGEKAVVESILKRLSQQVGSKEMATRLLEKRKQMKDGKLTALGKKREALGRDGRANDRAAKYNGGKPSDYKYNPKTNTSTKKKK
jgi:hypothetical protein